MADKGASSRTTTKRRTSQLILPRSVHSALLTLTNALQGERMSICRQTGSNPQGQQWGESDQAAPRMDRPQSRHLAQAEPFLEPAVRSASAWHGGLLQTMLLARSACDMFVQLIGRRGVGFMTHSGRTR